MARPVHIGDEEVQQARLMRDQALSIARYRKALSVTLVAELGLDTERTADMLGISRRMVFRNRKYIRYPDDTKRNSWGGRRRSSMTMEEEKEFLAQWEAGQKAAACSQCPRSCCAGGAIGT